MCFKIFCARLRELLLLSESWKYNVCTVKREGVHPKLLNKLSSRGRIPDPHRGPSLDGGGHGAALAVALLAAAALPVLGQQALRKPEIGCVPTWWCWYRNIRGWPSSKVCATLHAVFYIRDVRKIWLVESLKFSWILTSRIPSSSLDFCDCFNNIVLFELIWYWKTC